MGTINSNLSQGADAGGAAGLAALLGQDASTAVSAPQPGAGAVQNDKGQGTDRSRVMTVGEAEAWRDSVLAEATRKAQSVSDAQYSKQEKQLMQNIADIRSELAALKAAGNNGKAVEEKKAELAEAVEAVAEPATADPAPTAPATSAVPSWVLDEASDLQTTYGFDIEDNDPEMASLDGELLKSGNYPKYLRQVTLALEAKKGRLEPSEPEPVTSRASVPSLGTNGVTSTKKAWEGKSEMEMISQGYKEK